MSSSAHLIRCALSHRIPTVRKKQGRRPAVLARGTETRAPELKAKDTVVSHSVNTSGQMVLLNGTLPGVGFNERVGRQIRVKRIIGRLTANNYTTKDQFHRFLLVLDHQPNGAALSITDVLDSISVRAMVNLSNQARFQVLRDEIHHLNATSEAFSLIPISFDIAKRFVVQYNAGVAGTVADIATNSLYFIAIGDQAPGADAGTVAGTIRVRYTDE